MVCRYIYIFWSINCCILFIFFGTNIIMGTVLSTYVKAKRKEYRLTQVELAEKAGGCSKAIIGRIFAGTS